MVVIALLGMTTVLTAEDKKLTFALVTHEIGSGFCSTCVLQKNLKRDMVLKYFLAPSNGMLRSM